MSAKLVPTFAGRGCCVVSATDPHCRILGFLDRNSYYFFQVSPQLYSRGWVDPVPDPLLLRKSGSARDRTRDLWICSQELWPLDHREDDYPKINRKGSRKIRWWPNLRNYPKISLTRLRNITNNVSLWAEIWTGNLPIRSTSTTQMTLAFVSQVTLLPMYRYRYRYRHRRRHHHHELNYVRNEAAIIVEVICNTGWEDAH
jgi:hypothetical protein